MTAILTYLIQTGVTMLIGTLIFGTLWGSVMFLFNTLMDAQFTSFTGLNSFIKILSGMTNGDEFTVLLQRISITILIIVTLFSVIKSMASPLAGKESTSPGTVLMKSAVAAVCIGFYPKIVDFIIEILNTFASSPLFHKSINLGVIDTAGLSFASFADIGIILNVVAIVAIFIGMLMAAVSYLERYLSFALYIALGPICFAFYPGKDTESLLREWFMGVLSQIFGILVCLFALTMVGNQLEGIGLVDGFIPNTVVGTTTIAKFLVVIALLGFVRNSEQFINMLGLRTMPNQDAARSFFGAFATTAGLGIAAVKGFTAGKNAYEKYFNGEKMGSSAVGGPLNKQAKTMVNQASQVNGSGFKDQVKNRQIESARAIAQTQLAQGKAGSKEPMSKKDFIKWQDRVGVGHRNDDEAYKAYTNELDVAKSAKAALFASPQQVFNEKGEPYFKTSAYNGKANIKSNSVKVDKDNLTNGLVNKYNTGVTPLSNAMEFTSEEMKKQGVRGFAFMGEVVGPDGKTTQKPMAAFVGQEIMDSKEKNGVEKERATGAYAPIDSKVLSSGKFYGYDPNSADVNKLDDHAYIPFSPNGQFHTSENGVMVAELNDASPYSFKPEDGKKTGAYGDTDHYVAHFGMDEKGDFQIVHVEAPSSLDDIRHQFGGQLSDLYKSQHHVIETKNEEGKTINVETTSVADALYNIEHVLMDQKQNSTVQTVPTDFRPPELEQLIEPFNEDSSRYDIATEPEKYNLDGQPAEEANGGEDHGTQ